MADVNSGEKKLPERIKEKVKEALPVKDSPVSPTDPNSIVKDGFLGRVRKERPMDERVRTRFPPEPNGFLHIGHVKAIMVNFKFAEYYGGTCVLRYDDTNPEKELEEYFDSILEVIRWLGFEPADITYSSDRFEWLYEQAEKLISLDKAYVCHCTPEDLKEQRGGTDDKHKKPRFACKHRDRPTKESLAEFRKMREGGYEAGEAFLRFKTDDYKPETGNPQLWDLSAYRIIKKTPHHRTGDKWCIYPTYDFAHCLCDSYENITHSLCTTEFKQSRITYEWLNNTLDVPFKPIQREYGRLSLEGVVTSKRKIKELVDTKIVADYDDPRLYTIIALRRRGIPPGALLSFVTELGVTTSPTVIQIVRLEQSVRKYLEMTVPRVMLIIDPIPVIIENLPEDYVEEFENAFGPKDIDMGSHKIPFTKKIYIDREDFEEVGSKDFRRLTSTQSVGLMKVPHAIKTTSVKKDEITGLVIEIRAVYDNGEDAKKPKSYIHWVADSPAHGSPVKAIARVFNPLFKPADRKAAVVDLVAEPKVAEGDSVADLEAAESDSVGEIREDSLIEYPNAMLEVGFKEISRRRPWPEEAGEKDKTKCGPETVRFQGMRVGYFCMDKDSNEDRVVLNRIVGLKEDAGKNEDVKKVEAEKRKEAAKAKKDAKAKQSSKAKGGAKVKAVETTVDTGKAV